MHECRSCNKKHTECCVSTLPIRDDFLLKPLPNTEGRKAFKVVYVPEDTTTTELDAPKGEVDTLLTDCSDFRFVGTAIAFLNERYDNGFDQIVLPGASAGVVNFPDWQRSYFEQVDILLSLRQRNRLHVMDHEDCGVYKALYGDCYYKKHMYQLHAINLRKCRDLIIARHPHLSVKMLLMLLDGTVLELR